MTEEIIDVTRKETTSTKERLSVLKDILIKTYEKDTVILINLFHLQASEALNRLSPDLIKQIKNISAIFHKAITAIVQEGIELEVLHKSHPVAISDIIWGIFSGVVLWSESKHRLNQKKNFGKKT